MCVHEWVSHSHPFSWALFLLLVLSNSDGLVFVSSYILVLSCKNQFFIMRDRRGVDVDGREGGWDLEGVAGYIT